MCAVQTYQTGVSFLALSLGQKRQKADSHPVVVLLDKVAVLLQDLVQPSLDAVLAAAQRVAVVVQQSVHVSTLHHLHQDRGELTFQSQQTLQSQTDTQTDDLHLSTLISNKLQKSNNIEKLSA